MNVQASQREYQCRIRPVTGPVGAAGVVALRDFEHSIALVNRKGMNYSMAQKDVGAEAAIAGAD